MSSILASPPALRSLPSRDLHFSADSLAIYGDPADETDGLLESVRARGVLVPLVVARVGNGWEVISGNRRLACALALRMAEVPCEIRQFGTRAARRLAILEYNRQRHKTFSQMMREADALEDWHATEGRKRKLANLRPTREGSPDRRNSDDRADRTGRTDDIVALAIGIGGKDLYRQARTIWRMAGDGDPRARSGVAQLDAGTKTVFAAYKDLRRRDRFTTGFRPTPYDVWSFKHDRAFGIPHPGTIPPAIVAHTLHYYSAPDALVVDPMAGGGTTIDVCTSMGRRYLAYDIEPGRPEILAHDVKKGFPLAAHGCDLVFCDPPYHTMLARKYHPDGVANSPLSGWLDFLKQFSRDALSTLRPGGYLALLLANQTEKDLPAGYGYLDHAFYGYSALVSAGFLPERRVSCPMDGAYRPQDVQRSRVNGRMLGQVRDLIIVRKPMI